MSRPRVSHAVVVATADRDDDRAIVMATRDFRAAGVEPEPGTFAVHWNLKSLHLANGQTIQRAKVECAGERKANP